MVLIRAMVDTQSWSVKCNTHTSVLATYLDGYMRKEDYVDVTISCSHTSLKAHKVILSACSPYFEKLLKENPCPHPIIIFKDVESVDMQLLLDFMYTGEMNVPNERMASVMMTAQFLQIRGLCDMRTNNCQEQEVQENGGESSNVDAREECELNEEPGQSGEDEIRSVPSKQNKFHYIVEEATVTRKVLKPSGEKGFSAVSSVKRDNSSKPTHTRVVNKRKAEMENGIDEPPPKVQNKKPESRMKMTTRNSCFYKHDTHKNEKSSHSSVNEKRSRTKKHSDKYS